jgi:predicted lysophospholipase L1 biosynthesis ABC-type transport system permease subunit
LLPAGSTCLASGATQLRAASTGIDANYLATMALPLLRGRGFDATDRTDSAPVAIVSEALERRLWPNGGAIGAPLTVGCSTPGVATVVGVVRDAAIARVGEPPQPHVYFPFSQAYAGGVASIVMHTAGPPGAMTEPARRTLRGLGEAVRIYQLEPLADYVDRSHAPLRWSSSVLALFGAIALLLAVFGLFGVIAYRVTQRAREIGVRMAVGATRANVLRHVLGWGLTIVAIGILLGELLTLPLARVIASLQVGAQPPDLVTHAAVIGIWLVAGLLGCLAPALRAIAINPASALREN